MGVGGQRHAPAALSPGKTRCPLYRRLDGPHGLSGRVRKISSPPGFELRTKVYIHSTTEIKKPEQRLVTQQRSFGSCLQCQTQVTLLFLTKDAVLCSISKRCPSKQLSSWTLSFLTNFRMEGIRVTLCSRVDFVDGPAVVLCSSASFGRVTWHTAELSSVAKCLAFFEPSIFLG